MAVSKKAIGATVGAAALAAVYAADKLYIDSDGGGSVIAYVQKYDQLYKNGTHVVVRGFCASSCTMVLGYPNSCLMPDARLGFHPAHVPILFGLLHYQIHPAATKIMRDHYPPDALAVIDQHGGLTNKGGWFYPAITVIPAKEFPKRYQC